MNKIALGTAQVGMSYGINNKRGKYRYLRFSRYLIKQ